MSEQDERRRPIRDREEREAARAAGVALDPRARLRSAHRAAEAAAESARAEGAGIAEQNAARRRAHQRSGEAA